MRTLRRLSLRSLTEVAVQAIPFALIEVALATHGFIQFGWPLSPLLIGERYWPTLVTIDVTMAVFAVNFSFVEYQFSAYRGILRRIAPGQAAAAAGTMILALLPLLGFAFGETWVPTIALLVAPVVAFAGLVLVQLSRMAVHPERILAYATSPRRIARFAREFLMAAQAALLRPPELRTPRQGNRREPRRPHLATSLHAVRLFAPSIRLSRESSAGAAPSRSGAEPNDLWVARASGENAAASRAQPPLHELTWRLTPAPLDDPFATIVSVATTAVQVGDARTFEIALEYALDSLQTITRHAHEPRRADGRGEGVPENSGSALVAHALLSIEQIGVAARELDRSDAFAAKFLNRCAVFLDVRLGEPGGDEILSTGVLAAMSAVAVHLLARGSTQTALVPLVAVRWLAMRAIQVPPVHRDTDGKPLTAAPAYALTMQRLGEAAIRAGAVEYVYRALEGLGLLAAAAVRNHDPEVGSACLNGIVQLGRLARAANLQCHWRRCAFAPADHARQRLDEIVPWIIDLPDHREREWWRCNIGEALSRLSGRTHRLDLLDTSEGREPRVTDTNVAHVVAVAGSANLNYADERMVKEYELV